MAGDVDALEQQLAGHRPGEVEPLAHLLGGGQQSIDLVEVESGRVMLLHGSPGHYQHVAYPVGRRRRLTRVAELEWLEFRWCIPGSCDRASGQSVRKHARETRPSTNRDRSSSVGDRASTPSRRRALLTTPIPANVLPGARGVVELGDVVRIAAEPASFPIFRHNGRPAEMVTAELAGAFEAPLYGMLAVRDALDAQDWTGLPKPAIKLHGQPEDESTPVLLWDGEWEVTWVTFRDMGAAFGVALLGIYILVVAQFGSFKLPLVILTPIPLTFIGIMLGHWLFHAPFTATSMIGFIALAGIIVRNSILLVDFIRHARTPDRPLTDVLLEAGSIRFKPILLTALAAMIGAAVILADPIFQGLAISLLFGLASSTLLTVLVIPAIYIVLRGGGHSGRPTPLPLEASH